MQMIYRTDRPGRENKEFYFVEGQEVYWFYGSYWYRNIGRAVEEVMISRSEVGDWIRESNELEFLLVSGKAFERPTQDTATDYGYGYAT